MSEKIMKNIPKLRFPEFINEPEWQKIKLNKLGKLVSGLTYTPEDIREDGLLVLRSSNVQDGEIKLEDNVYVRTDIKGANLSEPNDILICVRNGSKALIGKNALIPDNMPLCTHGAFMTIFRTKLSKFVFQLFQTKDYERQVNADLGATINSINGNKFIKYEFYVPITEEEQQKITDCLSSVDNLILSQTKKVELLKEHKKALLQNLFPRDGENVPPLRFPEFLDDGEWKEKILGDVVDYKNGKAHENDILENGDYIVVNSKFISTEGEIVKYTDSAFCLASKNDILMVLSDVPNGKAIAKCYLVEFDNLYTVNQRICKITTKKIISKFLFYVIDKNKYFLSFDDGVKQTNLRKEDVLNCPIVIPSNIDEQQKIADCLTSIDEQINLQIQKVESLKEHKKALLQQLFSSNEVING
ncbi:restriction endonuclease subunit S [Aliarcobacter butzleri]|uniref:restriction endonuclease subunit S n=1 Tax=Aliarcobacter butzleri TaxID=28197 RepID=UPI0012FB926C|nr:restriction endonuclease subunit S [Aliarcobacter butzleri]MDN5124927.1 restriction endonuclease subunit S [Aliarcobacter butzleri]